MTATERVSSETGERLPAEVVNDLLADEECHRVLTCLAGREDPMAVEDLARALAARESDDGGTVDDESVAAYRDALFQEYLPKLTPTGVVTYNSLLGTVALDTTDDRLLSALD